MLDILVMFTLMVLNKSWFQKVLYEKTFMFWNPHSNYNSKMISLTLFAFYIRTFYFKPIAEMYADRGYLIEKRIKELYF